MATVLLAEDDADIRLLVALKLQQAGHEVRAFADGASALADARKRPPDLAVLDVVMPGMNGLEVCRALRQHPDTARVLIIILTARAQQADVTAGYEAGANDYVVKPFSPRELATRVQALLARV
jgi:DNA-binding response OmpR family regulator